MNDFNVYDIYIIDIICICLIQCPTTRLPDCIQCLNGFSRCEWLFADAMVTKFIICLLFICRTFKPMPHKDSHDLLYINTNKQLA